MTGTDKAAAIREKAERLAGRSLGENGDALTEMAMERACAWCGRNAVTRWAYVRARMSAKALSVTVHPSFSRPSLRHGASPASAAACPSETA